MATDKHVLISDKPEGSGKRAEDRLPGLANHSLNDMRALNRHDANGGNAVTEFGKLELVDDTVPLARKSSAIGGDDQGKDPEKLPGLDKDPPGGEQHFPDKDGDKPRPVDHREPAIIEAEKQAGPLAEEYGLDVEAVRNADGEIEYHYYVPATDTQPRQDVLSTSDSTPESQLKLLRETKILQLEKAYGVDINGSGHEVTHGETTLVSRAPTFAELSALDSALLHGQPSQLNADGSRMEVNFFDRPNDPDFHAVGFYKDNSINLVDIANGSHDAEKIIEHELGHHAQDEIGGFEGTKNPELEEHYNDQGWTLGDDGKYLVQREDGALFLAVEDGDKFVRTNVHGEFLDAEGNVVSSQAEAETLTNQQMLESARVPHVHEPMPSSPNEHDAEAQAYFRHSREFREHLYQTSPELYAEQKRFDQEQIDRFYGKDENGVSRYIRNPDGLLVPNTAENRAEVCNFEVGLKLDQPKEF